MDIDLDLPTTFDPADFFNITKASMVKDGKLIKHPAGAYFQNIAVDKVTGLSAIPYKQAEELGYFKIDFLHLNVLDHFSSKNELRELLKTEPDWLLLQSATEVAKLFQISKHFDVLVQIKPTSVMELADSIALIRPAKKHLLEEYLRHKERTRPKLYTKPKNNKYYFKKGHAVSYALTIVLQLHLITANRI